MLTVRCTCGEAFHSDERSIGRRLRCRCGRIVEITAPEPPPAPAPRAVRPPAPRRPPPPRRAPAASLLRPLRILCWAYLAGVLAATLLLWSGGDRWWPATLLLFSGRWVLLTPLLALVPLAALVRRRLLAPLGLAAAVGIGPLAGLQLNAHRALSSTGPEGASLRVVSFNAGGSSAVADDLHRLLAGWGPDLVALQECSGALVDAVKRAEGWTTRTGGGLCLLSRFPIRDEAAMDRETLQRIRETTTIGGAGNVVRYTVETPQGEVAVTNLHLETPRKGFEALAGLGLGEMRANTYLRSVESRLARRWADEGGGLRLVMGDFNMPVESRIYRESWSGMGNAFSAVGRGFGMTKHNGWIRVRIDHVLYGDGFRPTRAVVDDYAGSDHRPLVVDLALRTPG